MFCTLAAGAGAGAARSAAYSNPPALVIAPLSKPCTCMPWHTNSKRPCLSHTAPVAPFLPLPSFYFITPPTPCSPLRGCVGTHCNAVQALLERSGCNCKLHLASAWQAARLCREGGLCGGEEACMHFGSRGPAGWTLSKAAGHQRTHAQLTPAPACASRTTHNSKMRPPGGPAGAAARRWLCYKFPADFPGMQSCSCRAAPRHQPPLHQHIMDQPRTLPRQTRTASAAPAARQAR